MATIKSYSDLQQSKKLAEILPIESADICYVCGNTTLVSPTKYGNTSIKELYKKHIIPAWSLAALLDILPYPQLSKDKLGSGKEGWMISVYPNDCRYDSCWHDNPVDACIEMIIKLNELKLL